MTKCESNIFQDHLTFGNVPNGESGESTPTDSCLTNKNANCLHHFGCWTNKRKYESSNTLNVDCHVICLSLKYLQIFNLHTGVSQTDCFHFLGGLGVKKCIFLILMTSISARSASHLRGEVAAAKLCLQRLGVGLDQA